MGGCHNGPWTWLLSEPWWMAAASARGREYENRAKQALLKPIAKPQKRIARDAGTEPVCQRWQPEAVGA